MTTDELAAQSLMEQAIAANDYATAELLIKSASYLDESIDADSALADWDEMKLQRMYDERRSRK